MFFGTAPVANGLACSCTWGPQEAQPRGTACQAAAYHQIPSRKLLLRLAGWLAGCCKSGPTVGGKIAPQGDNVVQGSSSSSSRGSSSGICRCPWPTI
ncbi:uncharacterized protein LOC143023564 isoform X3 [Oratosquilla oratoria]|uniref:uncharacterized protein LOC143023564 isoform X3 n=1 Tax=Oratosquilla oratoria TaxID=337810 RepID=UPI003F75DCA0